MFYCRIVISIAKCNLFPSLKKLKADSWPSFVWEGESQDEVLPLQGSKKRLRKLDFSARSQASLFLTKSYTEKEIQWHHARKMWLEFQFFFTNPELWWAIKRKWFSNQTNLNTSVSLMFSSSIGADDDGACFTAVVVKLLPRGSPECSTWRSLN